MGKYRTGNDLGGTQQDLSTSYKTIVSLIGAASAPRRAKVFELSMAADASPVDSPIVMSLVRMTADNGTKTNVTPVAHEEADAATTMLSRANFSAEGTLTSNSSLLTLSFNSRATFQWMAAPGNELVTPATASNGFALLAKGISAGYQSTGKTVLANMRFEE